MVIPLPLLKQKPNYSTHGPGFYLFIFEETYQEVLKELPVACFYLGAESKSEPNALETVSNVNFIHSNEMFVSVWLVSEK